MDLLDQIFLNLVGRRPTKKQKLVLMACFDEFWRFENEIEPPSSAIALLLTACGQKLPQVLASSINSFGEKHFCFSEIYKHVLWSRHEEWVIGPKIVSGLGHPKYKKEDPRVIALLKYFKQIKYKNRDIEEMLNLSLIKRVPLNVGGLITCVLIDCGCNEYNIDYFPIICRCLGLTKIYQRAKEEKVKFGPSHEIIAKFGNTKSRRIS